LWSAVSISGFGFPALEHNAATHQVKPPRKKDSWDCQPKTSKEVNAVIGRRPIPQA
jgi:hypothetical protein